MAARKLQGEIDRTLKKVSEGVELFESIYDKMQASTNQTQKEKLETDLKTQIKKLQRLRDQIKTWVASNDIKDKSQLLENRKLIETQMEKFKACEKEMKTKAFSKEGLIQASKLDPKAQEKLETTQWLQTKVEELTIQVEQAEAEIENLQGGAKKKNKGGANGRLEELERLNDRRKWHISRLEIVLRLLDNGSLAVERVNELKEDVSYFVESNTDENFDEDEGIYDELNLDEEEEKFGLVADDDDSDEDSDDGSDDLPPRTPSKKPDDDSHIPHKREEHSPILKKSSVTLQIRKHSNAVEPQSKPPPPNPNFAAQPMSSIVKSGLPRSAPLPVKYAAVAAAQSSTTASAHPPASSTSGPSVSISTSQPQAPAPQSASQPSPLVSMASATSAHASNQDQHSAVATSPSLTHQSVSAASPLLSSASGQHADSSMNSNIQSPAISEAVPPVSVSQAASSPQRTTQQYAAATSPVVEVPTLATPSTAPAEAPQQPIQPAPSQASTTAEQPTLHIPPVQPLVESSPLPQQLQQYPVQGTMASSVSSPLPPSQPPAFPPGVKVPQVNDETGGASHLASQQTAQRLASPVSTQQQQGPFSSHMLQQPPARAGPSNMHATFPGSLSDLVASFESVKQKAPHRMANLEHVHKMLEGGYATMPQPQDTEKPKYYVPRNPFHTAPYYPQSPNPILSSPALFAQLDIETLFYVFYYLPGTYQQYMAAKELKRQSWRFHVKYLTWFQRHSEPQAITEEYEQGVYVYFDWEGSWCQRKKSDFRFEYRYLSED